MICRGTVKLGSPVILVATKFLKSARFVFAQVDERERLLEDMARWEEAENTVDERLIASGGESA